MKPRLAHGSSIAASALLFALLLAAPTACAADPVDLVGTWYVLVHYRDTDTAHPEAYRWDDRVWVIARKGSRLEWTEYPIVVFSDSEGRFERDASGARGRVLHAWEPNGSQRREIEKGLTINPRGKKRKTLRKKGGSYESVSSSAGLSASQVTYQEQWSIGDPEGLPIFQRRDTLGSARAETMDGVTRYSVTDVLREGEEMRGNFERDESRRGRFRMMRAGAIGRVPKRKKREDRSGLDGDGADGAVALSPAERRELDVFRQRIRELEGLDDEPAEERAARPPGGPAAADPR